MWEEVQIGEPGFGEARVRRTAVGVNFVDIRSGFYAATLPSGIGTEAAGIVEQIGFGVGDVAVGDRVAYVGGPLDAYAEARVMPADRLVVLAHGYRICRRRAMMLKGLTTQYLIRQIFKVRSGNAVLLHAAASAVGLIACQWAKALRATVIGTVGSDQKAQVEARPAAIIRSSTRARTLSVRSWRSPRGKRCRWSTILSARARSWIRSIASRLKGLMVSFGQSSGARSALLDLGIFAQKGLLFFTRPTL